jgi:hypothetical protein
LLARGEGTYDLHDLQDVQTRGLKEELLSSRAMWDSLKSAMEEQRTQTDLKVGKCYATLSYLLSQLLPAFLSGVF